MYVKYVYCVCVFCVRVYVCLTCLSVCVNHTDSVCSLHWLSQVDQRDQYQYRETIPVRRDRTSTERPYQYR